MTAPASLALSLSTVALIPAVFGASLPPLAEVHARADEPALAAGYKAAVGTSLALVLAVTYVSRSRTVAVAGASAVALFAVLYKQARNA